jgi:hypothetical protein
VPGRLRAGRGVRATGVVLAVILAVVVSLAASTAPAAPGHGADREEVRDEAQELYELGMAHFRTRGFSEAARAFEAAYALDPRREVLFALAQATRLSGDCAGAVPLYNRFLTTDPPGHQIEAARIALARCQDPTPARPPPMARPAPLSVQRPAWYRDAAGGALAAAAVLSLTAGVGLLVASRMADREHREALVYGQADARRSAAQSRQRWGTAALLSATALGLAAGGRWLWLGTGATF